MHRLTFGWHPSAIAAVGMVLFQCIFLPINVQAQVSYTNDVQPIFDTGCVNRGCHPGGGAPFSLHHFLSWSNLYYADVSIKGCGAQFRVLPFEADSSMLYLRVSGRTPCVRMPFSSVPGDTLSLLDQNTIRDWINEGAPNDMTGVSQENDPIPHMVSLFQNYPNPFNPTTTFSFSIPQSSIVNLSVFDLLGQEIEVLMNEEKPPGEYTVQWDASNITSGVYFYRLQAGLRVETRKLLLLR